MNPMDYRAEADVLIYTKLQCKALQLKPRRRNMMGLSFLSQKIVVRIEQVFLAGNGRSLRTTLFVLQRDKVSGRRSKKMHERGT
jgi:hypothetical protein